MLDDRRQGDRLIVKNDRLAPIADALRVIERLEVKGAPVPASASRRAGTP